MTFTNILFYTIITCVFGQSIFNCNEVLQRLGHFAACNRKVARVQKVANPVVIVKEGL